MELWSVHKGLPRERGDNQREGVHCLTPPRREEGGEERERGMEGGRG